MTSSGRNILVIDSVLQYVLNKQFMGIISFQTHSYLDTLTLFLQLRRKSQGISMICLWSHAWKAQEQVLEPKSIYCNIHWGPGKLAQHLGFSYRSGSGHLVRTPANHPPFSAPSSTDATEHGGKSRDHFNFFCYSHN